MNSAVRKPGVEHAPLATAAAWLENRVDKTTQPTRHTSIKAKQRLLSLRFLVNLGWDITADDAYQSMRSKISLGSDCFHAKPLPRNVFSSSIIKR